MHIDKIKEEIAMNQKFKKTAALIVFVVLIGIWFLLPDNKDEVHLDRCVDGDTAWFEVDGESFKTRFLAIDAPEYTKKIEPWGKEASEMTCALLKEADKIELESDPNADRTDDYDRKLVWVFVDGELLQETLVREGLAEVTYLYDDYKYTDELFKTQDLAKEEHLGIWE